MTGLSKKVLSRDAVIKVIETIQESLVPSSSDSEKVHQ